MGRCAFGVFVQAWFLDCDDLYLFLCCFVQEGDLDRVTVMCVVLYDSECFLVVLLCVWCVFNMVCSFFKLHMLITPL